VLLEDFGALARELKLVDTESPDTDALVQATRAWLLRSSGWLLVFDGLEDVETIANMVPQGGQGEVIVTTRQGSGLRRFSQPSRCSRCA
jgi:hypothetical protein